MFHQDWYCQVSWLGWCWQFEFSLFTSKNMNDLVAIWYLIIGWCDILKISASSLYNLTQYLFSIFRHRVIITWNSSIQVCSIYDNNMSLFLVIFWRRMTTTSVMIIIVNFIGIFLIMLIQFGNSLWSSIHLFSFYLIMLI